MMIEVRIYGSRIERSQDLKKTAAAKLKIEQPSERGIMKNGATTEPARQGHRAYPAAQSTKL